MHVLKVWPEFYEVIKSHDKTFEVRKNDRDFKPGDGVMLLEYFPAEDRYSGREIRATVGYFMGGGKMGVEEGYCVIGLSGVHEVYPQTLNR